MRALIFLSIIHLMFFACVNSTKQNKLITIVESASLDTTNYYKTISLEICNCTFSTMKPKKPSTSMDSCYNVVIKKHTDSLRQLGLDPTDQLGENKLMNEVISKFYTNCPDLYKLMREEHDSINSKKLIFKGEFVSQTKLPSGLYKIVLKNVTTKEIKTFFSKNILNEKQLKEYLPGYELTVEYEIVTNKATKKNEYFLKENGNVSSVGAVEINVQQ